MTSLVTFVRNCRVSFRLAATCLLFLFAQQAPNALGQIFIPGFPIPNPTATFTATNTIRFLQANYFAQEDSPFARIIVLREGVLTNADFISIEYSMADGTAQSGVHYFRVTARLTFLPGEDRAEFQVPLIDNFSQGGNVSLTLILRNPGSGFETFAALGEPSTATLTIIDDESVPVSTEAGFVEIAPGSGNDFYFGTSLDTGTYGATREEWNVGQNNNANFTPYGPAGVQVTFVRKGGSRGKIEIDWRTTTNVVPFFGGGFFFFDPLTGFLIDRDPIARPGEDFIPTNGTVTLDDYQMATNVIIRLPADLQREGIFFGGTNFFTFPPVAFGVELTAVRPVAAEAEQGVNPVLGTAVQQRIALFDVTEGFAFSRKHYVVSEGQRFVRIRVRRSRNQSGDQPFAGVHVHYVVNPLNVIGIESGGDHLDNIFPLKAGSEYATPFLDFEPPGSDVWDQTMMREREAGRPQVQDDTQGIITWGDGRFDDFFLVIPLIDDDVAEFNEDLQIILYKHDAETDGFVNFSAGVCTVTIIDNDQPAGASEVTFNPDLDPLTDPPYLATPGANHTVQAVAVQADGKVVIGGDFTAVNATNRVGLARLNFDGSVDHGFNVGSGVSGFIRAVALQPDGKVLVGGYFDAINGVARFGIARLMTNGTVDPEFNAGEGPDAAVRSIAVQADGKILVGGEFTRFDGTNVNYFARLNPNGKLDTSFQPGSGPDGPVNSIALTSGYLDLARQQDGGAEEDRFAVDTGSSQGQIVINYDFFALPDHLRVYYGGTLIYDSGLINSNGTITVNYPPAGVPANSTSIEVVINEDGNDLASTLWIYNMVIYPTVDPRPVIGGEFIEYNGTPINFIARVNLDGSLDRTFNPGTGADDVVYSVAKQGNKVLMAGDFTTVDLRQRKGVARLNEDGTLDSGFDPGTGFDSTVFSVAVMPNGRPILGGSFRSFNSTRRVGLARLNIDGTLDTTFMDTAKNQFAGLINSLSPENPLSQENFIRSLAPYRATNFTIVTNEIVDTNGVTNLVPATNFFATDHVFIGGHFTRVGGGFLRDQARPRYHIARINGGITPGPGNIGFMRDSYAVDENAGSTFITMTRTNGALAPISTRFEAADFPTTGPGIATSGIDYFSTNTFPLWVRSYGRGDTFSREFSAAFMGPNFDVFTPHRHRGDFTVYQFPAQPPLRFPGSDLPDDNVFVNVLDDALIEGPEVIQLTLTAPDEGRLLLGGQPIPVGTALARAHASLTIADNDFDYGTLGFSSLEYFVDENGTNALVTITREGGSSGAISVDVYTENGSANSGDFIGISRRRVDFLSGQISNTFTIRIRNDQDAELEETVSLFLTNATGFDVTVPLERRLDPARSSAILNILDDDFTTGRISYTAATYTVSENEREVTVGVRRGGGNTGQVIVGYRTSNGSARAGEDYTHTEGSLVWNHGESGEKTFTIPLLGDDVVEGDETINVELLNPTVPDALGVRPEAVVRITNDDAVGTFSFSQFEYAVDENGPYADITVIRTDGISGNATLRFAATNLTAIGTTNAATVTATNGLPDYVFPEFSAQNGSSNVLRFVEGQTSASFRVPLVDDSIVESAKQVLLTLSSATGGARLGQTNAILSIIDDELNNSPAGQRDTTFEATGTDNYVYKVALQPDAKIIIGGDFQRVNEIVRNRLARLHPNGTLDASQVTGAGPNASVRALDLQANGRLFMAGLFTEVSGTPRNHLTRLNIDGRLDSTFDPGAGTDNDIYAAIEQPDGKFIVVGTFSTYRGEPRQHIARVGTNGVADVSFDPGTGANGSIWAVALQADGKILIGGDFTTFDGTPRNRLARLNRDGSLDTTFNVGTGANGSVRTILVQSDANILVGGLFTTFNDRPFNRIARLRATGAQAGQLDETFTLGFDTDAERAANGANGAVNVIALQIDGKILVGGDFTQFNSRTRNRVTRLNWDGSLDPTINFGLGANGPISDIVVQPDRRILLAGGFTEYDGAPAQHLVRIHGGSLAGSGTVQFSAPVFTANESGASALVGIRRLGGTSGSFTVDFATTTNDSAIAGIDFRLLTNRVEFPEAETFRTVLVPLLRNRDVLTNRSITVILTNIIGEAQMGVQTNSRVTIRNVDSAIQFSETEYSISEDFLTGAAYITVLREGSRVGPLSVDIYTEDITATAGSDYGALRATLEFAPEETERTFAVPIFDDLLVEGNEQVRLVLTNLQGEGVISQGEATLTIGENDSSPGEIEFDSATFVGSEDSRQVVVRLRRVGGTTGIVSVKYATKEGGEFQAETPGDYTAVTNQIVSFSDGETLQSFVIAVNDDNEVEGNESFIVQLSDPGGNATIRGATEAQALIVDNDLPSGSLDGGFDPGTGANGDIRVIKLTADGDMFIGGDFTIFNGTDRLRVARLNNDASIDTSFDPGVGADGTVAEIEFNAIGKLLLGGNFNNYQRELLNRVARVNPDGSVDRGFVLPLGLDAEVSEIVLQPDGKLVIGGKFTAASAAARSHIARLNEDGTVDLSFNPGIGTDNNVNAIALQSDGKVLIGGAFAVVNGTSRRGVARLNANGSVDLSFNALGAGAFGGQVNDLLLLENGKVLVVGEFTSFNGLARNRVALLNSDGSLDSSFDPGVGPNGAVYAVAQQKDGKFIIGGNFTAVSGASRGRVARLNVDGSHDEEFKPGTGANAAVLSVVIQPDDGKVMLGGRFTEFGNAPRAHIARLNNDREFITPRDVVFAPVVRVNGHLELTINSQQGFTYTLETSMELYGSWVPVATQTATGSSLTFEITPSETHQFFRVVRED